MAGHLLSVLKMEFSLDPSQKVYPQGPWRTTLWGHTRGSSVLTEFSVLGALF